MSTAEKTFNNGEVIIREGDKGNTFFQLLEGKVAVFQNYGKKDEVQVAIIEQGQYFGEMAVIENYPRSSTVVAEGDVKVVEIAAEELNEYIAQNPDKILSIMKVFGSRIASMTNDYNEAKKALEDARKANSTNKYEGFFMSMINQSMFLNAKNMRLEKPSAEALREAADKVSRQNTDNAETYPYGTIIYKEGEAGKYMYIVRAGRVCIYGNYGTNKEYKITDAEPVACFGEMGMLSDAARNETAVVEMADTQVEIIRPEDLEGLFKTSPAKIDMILKNLSYRLRSITYEYFKTCQEIYEYTGKMED